MLQKVKLRRKSAEIFTAHVRTR